MAWYITNAVGGIKLQVAAEDAEQARILLRELPADGELQDGDTQVPLTKYESEMQLASSSPPDEEDEPQLTDREKNAECAWRRALVGILFLPFEFYVFWLLLRVYVSEERLGADYYRRAWLAALVNLPLVFVMCLILRTFLTAVIETL
jgi:hypothetical protein